VVINTQSLKGVKLFKNMVRKKRDLIWIIENEFLKTLKGNGKTFFIVDTGVVIDMESRYNQGKTDLKKSPIFLLKNIENVAPIIIPEMVYGEMMKHREIRIGNRFEISSVTSELLYRLYMESREHLMERGVQEDKIDSKRDFHRYAVRAAALQRFKGDFRKGEKDTISETDVRTLSLALDLSQSADSEEPPVTVNVLSTDSHILITLNELRCDEGFKNQFGNYNVRGIYSRSDLRSYMRK